VWHKPSSPRGPPSSRSWYPPRQWALGGPYDNGRGRTRAAWASASAGQELRTGRGGASRSERAERRTVRQGAAAAGRGRWRWKEDVGVSYYWVTWAAMGLVVGYRSY
jgi:hypothetical protein